MKKYKYTINNLDCANCAREIEEALSKDKRFNNVVVNFVFFHFEFPIKNSSYFGYNQSLYLKWGFNT